MRTVLSTTNFKDVDKVEEGELEVDDVDVEEERGSGTGAEVETGLWDEYEYNLLIADNGDKARGSTFEETFLILLRPFNTLYWFIIRAQGVVQKEDTSYYFLKMTSEIQGCALRRGALPNRDHLLDNPHPTVGGALDEAVGGVRLWHLLDIPAQGLDGLFPVGGFGLRGLSPVAQSYILELSCYSSIWLEVGDTPCTKLQLLF